MLHAVALASLAIAALPASAQGFRIDGFKLDGQNPLGEAASQAVLKPFIGEAAGIERLQEAASALETELRNKGWGFYRVTLPPQEAQGMITLKVLGFKVGSVTVKGNRQFSDENIRASLPPLKEGEVPNSLALARSLAVANENPSKRVTAAFREGKAPDTIDVNLEAADSRPYYGFAVLNNSGAKGPTGRFRSTVGVSHANLFGLDHQFTATATSSPGHWNAVKQFGLNYRAPVYAFGGMVTGYYSYSTTSSGVIANAFNVTGGGKFGGLSYTQYFAPRGDYRDYVTIGIDDKHFLSNTTFIQANARVGALDTRTRPLSLGYVGRMEEKWGNWGFNVDYARNLRGGRDNTNAAYATSNANATTQWHAWRFGADANWQLPRNWLLTGRIKGQTTNRPLLSGEMFGVGGSSSVRGVEERIVSGERGWQTNLEITTPGFFDNRVRAVGFWDMGRISRIQPAPGVLGSESVASLGAGLRWNMATSFGLSMSANVDYGRVIRGTAAYPRGHDKLHFSLTARY
jgi:hemolysin activation/secretion protein